MLPSHETIRFELYEARWLIACREKEVKAAEAKAQSFVRESYVLQHLPVESRPSSYVEITRYIDRQVFHFRKYLEITKERYFQSRCHLNLILKELVERMPGRSDVFQQCTRVLEAPFPDPIEPPEGVISQDEISRWLTKILGDIEACSISSMDNELRELDKLLMFRR